MLTFAMGVHESSYASFGVSKSHMEDDQQFSVHVNFPILPPYAHKRLEGWLGENAIARDLGNY
jgi:hypothetical protein